MVNKLQSSLPPLPDMRDWWAAEKLREHKRCLWLVAIALVALASSQLFVQWMAYKDFQVVDEALLVHNKYLIDLDEKIADVQAGLGAVLEYAIEAGSKPEGAVARHVTELHALPQADRTTLQPDLHTPEQLVKALLGPAVLVDTTTGSIGSGVLVKTILDGAHAGSYVLTAGHVVANDFIVVVTLANQARYPALKIAGRVPASPDAPGADYAILKLPVVDVTPAVLSSDKLSLDMLPTTEMFLVARTNAYLFNHVTEGRLAQVGLNPKMVWVTNIDVTYGKSGGGMYRKSDLQFVGIVHAMRVYAGSPTFLAHYKPIHELRALTLEDGVGYTLE